MSHAHINPAAFSKLNDLLPRAFSLEEYRRFLTIHYREVTAGLPDVDQATYVFNSILSLERRAQLDERFFRLLRVERPKLCAEIDDVERSIGPQAEPIRFQILAVTSRLIDAIQGMAAANGDSHPIQQFILATVSGFVEDVTEGGNQVIEVEAHHYKRFIEAKTLAMAGGARAIADLCDSTEGFWADKVEGSDLWVEERIFLVDPADLADTERLVRHLEIFEEQARVRRVYVGDRTAFPWTGEDHHFGVAGVGAHLLLVGDDLVGGYVRRLRSVRLRLDRNESLFRRWETRYNTVRGGCIRYEAGMGAERLRAEWVRRRAVGRWEKAWGRVDMRTEIYFRYYDQHVQCWIPRYDELIKLCARAVAGEVYRQIQGGGDRLHVFEIGCGPGKLTREILGWADNLNSPMRSAGQRPPVASLTAIDDSRRMRVLFDPDRVRGEHRNLEVHHILGDWPGRRPTTRGRFACICGSLVLHHILSEDHPSLLTEFLRDCRDLLRDAGALVFADSFVDCETVQGLRAMTAWDAHMRAFGLADDDVRTFREANRDMIGFAPPESLAQAAAEAGFEAPQYLELPKHQTSPSAFRVLVLRVRPNRGAQTAASPGL